MKRLEQWSMQGEPYLAPECQIFHLHGQVFGHERHTDGKTVRTSRLVGKEGECVRTGSGSLYQLGEVHPDYEAMFPNAKERLLKRLLEMDGSSQSQ